MKTCTKMRAVEILAPATIMIGFVLFFGMRVAVAQDVPSASTCVGQTTMETSKAASDSVNYSVNVGFDNRCSFEVRVHFRYLEGMRHGRETEIPVRCSRRSAVAIRPGQSKIVEMGPLAIGIAQEWRWCADYLSQEIQDLTGFERCVQSNLPTCPKVALVTADDSPPPPRASTRQIQEALAAQGYRPGPADGAMGPKTRAAIKAWQQANGYGATGRLTGAQTRLLLEPRTAASETATAAATPPAPATKAKAPTTTTPATTPTPTTTQRRRNPYGSIAYARTSSGHAGGIAWNGRSHVNARQLALQQCREAGGGSACREIGWFRNACAAVAIGDNEAYGTGSGETMTTAERDALDKCRIGNRDCQVEISRCSDTPTETARIETPPTQDAEAIETAPAQDVQAAALDPTCDANPNAGCWKELSNNPGCYIWIDDRSDIPAFRYGSSTISWSGACSGGVATGEGKLAWQRKLGNHGEDLGTFSQGKRHGPWIQTWNRGLLYPEHYPYKAEGSYETGKRVGRWVHHHQNGKCWASDAQSDGQLLGVNDC